MSSIGRGRNWPRMIPKNVALKEELSEPLPPIEGDVSQIEQGCPVGS